MLVNKILKQSCKIKENEFYMEQDPDWIKNGDLNRKLYYKDNLHLIEAGNEKLAISITNMLAKIENLVTGTLSPSKLTTASLPLSSPSKLPSAKLQSNSLKLLESSFPSSTLVHHATLTSSAKIIPSYYSAQKSFIKQTYATDHPAIQISHINASIIPPYQIISHIHHRPTLSSYICESKPLSPSWSSPSSSSSWSSSSSSSSSSLSSPSSSSSTFSSSPSPSSLIPSSSLKKIKKESPSKPISSTKRKKRNNFRLHDYFLYYNLIF